MKVRDVIRRIESDGWRFARQRGSHRVYRHPHKPGTVTVAVGRARTSQRVPLETSFDKRD